MMKYYRLFLILCSILVATNSLAAVTVPMNHVDASGDPRAAGTVVAEQTEFGVVFTPELRGLTPGMHGFHVHQNPSCAPATKKGKMVPALGAGGHYDPAGSRRHAAPWSDGHLGDLPALTVNDEGRATSPVLAPRLSLADLRGRSLMVHSGGDNYSDQPKKLGGGGMRMVCGVVP